jgi:hypothetical protein
MPDYHWHHFDESTMAGWKSYPIRVRGPRPSSCCREQTLLVQSMEAGFITANCSLCGSPEKLSKAEFEGLALWVSCPACKHLMVSGMVAEAPGRAGNYGFICERCGCLVKLAWLLPHWSDVMPTSPRPTVEEVDAEYLPRLTRLVEQRAEPADLVMLNWEYQAARRSASGGKQEQGET